MKNTMYNEKRNTLYIRTDAIMPKYRDCDEYREAYKLSYEERISLYATDEVKKEIAAELEKHKNCKISQFTSADF